MEILELLCVLMHFVTKSLLYQNFHFYSMLVQCASVYTTYVLITGIQLLPALGVHNGQVAGVGCPECGHCLGAGVLRGEFDGEWSSQGGQGLVPPGRLGGRIHEAIVVHPAIVHKFGAIGKGQSNSLWLHSYQI